MRRRYELTDEEWNILDPLLPPARKKQGGRPPKDRRQMLNAVLWVARTGAPWRDLPSTYGPWSSSYSFFLGMFMAFLTLLSFRLWLK
ncbi:transposase [Paenibacillus sp. FSL M7-1046]|uniref:transposase n=1 Tax=Paenibacillus sp. FSL M7-1046 TaxID=2975315 RepID=UPI0030FA67D0